MFTTSTESCEKKKQEHVPIERNQEDWRVTGSPGAMVSSCLGLLEDGDPTRRTSGS
ncbi:hypothetical protein LIER_16752 [Lithospermum erythrorhizon]|uniref:Uncharacterized protein n=1 Tax=Lithospermum erythrorhizon TaxID=34254 RepID=A0AAV3QAI4_LITER